MIEDFISQIKTRGLARTNRYEVMIPFPQPDPRGQLKNIANLFCDAVTLPGAALSTTPMKTFGETREMPYEKIYDNVTMSFYVDSGLDIKVAFEDWMEKIFDTTTRTIGYYNNYITDVDIYIKNVDGTTPYKIRLHEAYPKALNSIQLDTNNKDIMKMTLTLQYKYWTSMTEDVINSYTPTGYWNANGLQRPQSFGNNAQGYSYITSTAVEPYDPPTATITR